MTKFPNSPNCQMEAWNQKWAAHQKGALHENPRHPERSEADDLLFPGGLIRAQSKDPVALRSPRSQISFGNALVRATPLASAAGKSSEVAAAVPGGGAFRSESSRTIAGTFSGANATAPAARDSSGYLKNPRHPERSEAKGSSTPSGPIRAQSKDPAALRSPRSQISFGNAIVCVTPLPAFSSTPTGLKALSPGLAHQRLPWVWVPLASNPVRVESIVANTLYGIASTPTGLGRLAGLPRVAAVDVSTPQPWAVLLQPFQGCSATAGKAVVLSFGTTSRSQISFGSASCSSRNFVSRTTSDGRGSALKLPQQARSQMKFGNARKPAI